MAHEAARDIAREVEAAPNGTLTLTVREIRDAFDLGRLTENGRSTIDRDLKSAGLMVDPPLSSGIGLDLKVTLQARPQMAGWSRPVGAPAPVAAAPDRSAGRFSPRAKRWAAWIGGGFLVLVIIGLIAGPDDGKKGSSAASTETTVAQPPPTTTEASGPTRKDVFDAAEAKDYDRAILLAKRIGDDDLRDRYRRRAALVLIRKAKRALTDERFATASREARLARARYGSAAREAPSIRSQAAAGRQQQVAAARQARVEARARRTAARERRAAERRAEEAADAAPDTSSGGGSSGGIVSGGKPGCDPATARDGDGDGIVCEP